MKKEFRLTRSKDFKRVRETGRTVYHPLVVLVYSRSEQSHPRLAVVASKVVGNAVTRNRVKRRVKSCLRGFLSGIIENKDLVFYTRKEIVNASYDEICKAIENLLMKADLLEN